MTLDERMNQFRLVSRDLFNHYFRIPHPYDGGAGWTPEERFSEVQRLLFRSLVIDSAKLVGREYGDVQECIIVASRTGSDIPLLLNREINSGYWDHPITAAPSSAALLFIGFFDWDQLDIRDNQYVRVKVENWPGHHDLAGKHALIESRHVRFEERKI
jgi:hypothetical protein